EVGGGVGAKAAVYPEQGVVAAAAQRLGRPVKWIETRSEGMLAMNQGRGHVQDVELGSRRDGTLVGLRARVTADGGAYPAQGAFLPMLTGQMASGCYRIPRIDFQARSYATNTTPTAAYRGAGPPEVTAAGSPTEFGRVDVDAEGRFTVGVGTASQGQGHETAYAMLAASRLGVAMDRVTVLEGDTGRVARGDGTQASRSLQLGGSAV